MRGVKNPVRKRYVIAFLKASGVCCEGYILKVDWKAGGVADAVYIIAWGFCNEGFILFGYSIFVPEWRYNYFLSLFDCIKSNQKVHHPDSYRDQFKFFLSHIRAPLI